MRPNPEETADLVSSGICLEKIRKNKDFTKKNNFFEGYSWLKYHKLGLSLGMIWKIFISVTKVLKPQVKNFWG